MSPLPGTPLNNLEQQHKLAKDLLSAARAGDATALARIRAHRTDAEPRLADAQLAIAREAGFASWPRLVEFVAVEETRAGLGPLFPRVTPDMRRVLFFSRYHAAQLGSDHIEPEHVLLGLLQNNTHTDQKSERLAVLEPLSLDACRADLRAAAGDRPVLPNEQQIPFSESTRDTFVEADREAIRSGGGALVRSGHLLAGLMRDQASTAASILTAHGVTLDAVREAIERNPPETPGAVP